ARRARARTPPTAAPAAARAGRTPPACGACAAGAPAPPATAGSVRAGTRAASPPTAASGAARARWSRRRSWRAVLPDQLQERVLEATAWAGREHLDARRDQGPHGLRPRRAVELGVDAAVDHLHRPDAREVGEHRRGPLRGVDGERGAAARDDLLDR